MRQEMLETDRISGTSQVDAASGWGKRHAIFARFKGRWSWAWPPKWRMPLGANPRSASLVLLLHR